MNWFLPYERMLYRMLIIVCGTPVTKNRLFKVKTARGLMRKSDEIFPNHISE